MNDTLIWIIILGVLLLAALIFLLTSLFNGSMKKFVIDTMAEAETMFPKGSDNHPENRRKYVIDKFQEKYKIFQFMLNCKKFIELVIQYSHKFK